MAPNRAERRRKTALIKRKLECEVQRELAEYARWESEQGTGFRSGRACYKRSEQAIRRRCFKNEGRNGSTCWDCGAHACDWCLNGFYRKHYQRAQALENDLQEYLNGSYDPLREEGDDIPTALIVRWPRPMGICRPK